MCRNSLDADCDCWLLTVASCRSWYAARADVCRVSVVWWMIVRLGVDVIVNLCLLGVG